MSQRIVWGQFLRIIPSGSMAVLYITRAQPLFGSGYLLPELEMIGPGPAEDRGQDIPRRVGEKQDRRPVPERLRCGSAVFSRLKLLPR